MSDLPPPPSGFSTNPKEAKAQAKAAKAHAKAIRPWYKKKRYIGLIAIAVIVIISVASGGGSDDKTSPTATDKGTTTTAASNDVLFPGRADAQKEDQERNIGDSAKLSGYTATVTAAGFQQSVSDFEDAGYITIDVTIANRDKKAQPYNVFDWKLQTPGGQVIDPGLTLADQLGSGDLVGGGSVSGKVVFEVGAVKGDYFIIYKPDAFDAARGIWKVTAG